MKKGICLLFIFLSVFAVPSQAQIPRTLSYQGVFTDTLGNPKPNGVYNFTFRLYETASGGSAVWTEAKNLTVTRGLFSTMLGDVTPFGPTVLFDRSYWLGVQPGTDPELSPRVRLSAAGYSIRAIRSDTSLYAFSAPPQIYVDSARIAGTVP